MRAIVVDPVKQEVREEETTGSLKALQTVVGGYIEAIYLDDVHPALAGHHAYVDEEGRLKPEKADQGWALDGWPEATLAGPMIILCSTRSGDEAAAKVSADTVRGLVTFGLRVTGPGTPRIHAL